MNILVTGSNGQLGRCLQDVVLEKEIKYPKHSTHEKNYWLFVGRDKLDITNEESIEKYFNDNSIDVVVNCAAYTDVNKAQIDRDNAYKINEKGVENLAKACYKHEAVLIHISTDYVFDGYTNVPYTPDDRENLHPLNIYGDSKLKGEIAIQNSNCKYLIFRTSWLYSIHGKNFVKTIVKKLINNEDIRVITDQIGSPTCAQDLADFLYYIIENNNADNEYLHRTGVYHFTNKGVASWYDLAYFIRREMGEDKFKDIECCFTSDYAKKVERPYYSVLSSRATEIIFNYNIPNWTISLKKTVTKLKKMISKNDA